MSRVGKTPINIPDSVKVVVAGLKITANGKLGTRSFDVPECVEIVFEENKLSFKPANKNKDAISLWGTTQRIVRNMISSVDLGSVMTLELTGVGYRASIQGSNLVLQLGYSHDIIYPIPTGFTIKCEKPTSIHISGPDKRQVGQIAAEIRSYRKPEPYKGKGVARKGEFILRKEGKKK